MSELSPNQKEALKKLLQQKLFDKNCVKNILSINKSTLHGDTITFQDSEFKISIVEHPFSSGHPHSHYLWIELTNLHSNISETLYFIDLELSEFYDIIKRYKFLVKEKEEFDIKSKQKRLDNLFNL